MQIDYAELAAVHMVGERRAMFSNADNPISVAEAQHVVGLEIAGWPAARSYWRMRRYGATHAEALSDAETVAGDPMAIEWYGTVRAAGGGHTDAMEKARTTHTHSYSMLRESRRTPDEGAAEVWIATCRCGRREEQRLTHRYTGD